MKAAFWVAGLWWRLVALLGLICTLTLAGGARLAENVLQQALHEAFDAPFVLAAERAVLAAEQTLALGMPLAPDTPVAGLLRREAQALEPDLLRLGIDTQAGTPLLQQGSLPPAGLGDADPAQLQRPIRNDLGQTVGQVRLEYDNRAQQQAQQQLHQAVQRALWPAMLVLFLALVLWGGWLLHALQQRRLSAWPLGMRALLVGGAALGLGVTLSWVGWHAHRAGQQAIGPAQEIKNQALARSSAALIARALESGVPAQALNGLPEHLARLHQHSPEVVTLAVFDPGDRLLAGTPAAGGWPTAVAAVSGPGGQPVARLVLGIDPDVFTRQLQNTLLDVAVLGIISLLLALEWMALGLGTRGARALSAAEARARAGSRPDGQPTAAAAVRPALFLFMLAEELTRPFLPTWTRALAPDSAHLSPELLASAPLVVFLALVALLQWPLAAWSLRLGRRRGLVWGAGLGALSLAGAALWPSYSALLLMRMLGALGFALVFVSAQGAVLDGSGVRDRARSLGQFVRTILVAALCGPPLGGLLADRWGVPAAFALAALLALLAALAAWWHLPAHRQVAGRPWPVAAAPISQGASAGPRVRGRGLWPLLLGCALPAKLLLAAWCFYLLPMHLQAQGHGHAVVGRLQVIYPLTMVLLLPLTARLTDRWPRRQAFVVAGGVLAGLSAWLAWPGAQTPGWLAWALLGLGLGQALSITAQSALVADRARQHGLANEAAVLGLFRLTERGGSALGPALGAWLLPWVGFGSALALIGSVVIAGSVVFGLSAGSRSESDKNR